MLKTAVTPTDNKTGEIGSVRTCQEPIRDVKLGPTVFHE